MKFTLKLLITTPCHPSVSTKLRVPVRHCSKTALPCSLYQEKHISKSPAPQLRHIDYTQRIVWCTDTSFSSKGLSGVAPVLCWQCNFNVSAHIFRRCETAVRRAARWNIAHCTRAARQWCRFLRYLWWFSLPTLRAYDFNWQRRNFRETSDCKCGKVRKNNWAEVAPLNL